MHKEQAKLINARCHLYEGTRPNTHVICAQTYTIKLCEFFTFYVVLDFFFFFFTDTKLKYKSKIKNKTMHTNKCKMHKMHENMTFNARRVQQKSKELDQEPKEQKLNHRNPSSSKRNDCLE